MPRHVKKEPEERTRQRSPTSRPRQQPREPQQRSTSRLCASERREQERTQRRSPHSRPRQTMREPMRQRSSSRPPNSQTPDQEKIRHRSPHPRSRAPPNRDIDGYSRTRSRPGHRNLEQEVNRVSLQARQPSREELDDWVMTQPSHSPTPMRTVGFRHSQPRSPSAPPTDCVSPN